MGQGVAYPPAGHGEALGQAVDHGETLGVPLPPGGQGRRFGRGIDQLVVNLVGNDENALLHGPGRDGVELVPGIVATRRVGRAVHDQAARARGARRLELFHADEKIVLRLRVDEDRHAVGQLNQRRVADPIWRRDYDLITRIEKNLEKIEEALLAAVGDHHVLHAGLHPVKGAEVPGHGSAQLGNARNRGVAGEALLHGHTGGLTDMLGSAEVRLADGQADDLPAGGAQFLRLGVDGQGRGRLDAGDALGQFHGRTVSSLRRLVHVRRIRFLRWRRGLPPRSPVLPV